MTLHLNQKKVTIAEQSGDANSARDHQRLKVVLIGFHAQHRKQTHGTFKFGFNALVSGSRGMDDIATGGSWR